MDGCCIKIDPAILEVNLDMGCTLGSVDHDLRSVIVGDLGHILDGDGTPGDIAAMGDGYQFHVLAHGILESFDVEDTVLPGLGTPEVYPH